MTGTSRTEFKFKDWNQLRDEFDQDYSWRNFAGFLLASRPRMVEQDIQFHREQLNRNAPNYLREIYRLETQGRALPCLESSGRIVQRNTNRSVRLLDGVFSHRIQVHHDPDNIILVLAGADR